VAYADTLAKMITRSGYTLQQISIKCNSYGVDISHSYISKLQTGKQSPPTDKVSEALAKACGGDPEILLYEGYLAKAPEFVHTLLTGLANFARQSTKAFTLPQLPQAMASMFEQHLDEIPDVELIKEFVNNDFLEQIGPTMFLKDHEDRDVKVMVNSLMTIKMPDTSMEPTIPVGSRLELTEAHDLNNGDVVISQTEDNSYIVRRYLRSQDHVILASESKDYAPIVLSPTASSIIAKVKSVVIEL